MTCSRIATIAILLFAVGIVDAATWYISPYGSNLNSGTTPQSPFLTLAAALDVAQPGDTISAANGVYSGSDNIDLIIPSNLTIEGKSQSSTIFQATSSVDVFNVGSGAQPVTFSKLTIVGLDSSDQGIEVNSGAGALVYDCTFENLNDGVWFSTGATTAYVDGCTFASSTQSGVTVYSSSSTGPSLPSLTVTNSVFQSAQGVQTDISSTSLGNFESVLVSGCSFYDSNVNIDNDGSPSTVTIENSSFSNWQSSSYYGPISIIGVQESVTLDGVIVSDSQDTNTIRVYNDKVSALTATVNDLWMSGCDGGVYFGGFKVNIADSGFVGNIGTTLTIDDRATSDASLTMDNSIFFANDATTTVTVISLDTLRSASISNSYFIQNLGGVVGADDCNVDITRSYFYHNSAGYYGGAIYAFSSANVTSSYSTFVGNSGEYGGAAAATDTSGISFRSCSLSQNVATSNGGAAYVANGARLTALLCSFNDNTAVVGGAWFSLSSPVNGEMLLIRRNNATEYGGGFACYGNGVSIINGYMTSNSAPTGSAYSCDGGCNTYLTHVYVAPNNDASGCSSDDLVEPLEMVEEAVMHELSAIGELDMAYILALIEEKTA